MFLATDLLRKAERQAAMDACPCGEAASVNWNIALNLVRDDFLEAIDLFARSVYLHEALCALVDGALIVNRAVANIRESKAAQLYLARRQPLGWLQVPTPVAGTEEDRRLRHGIEEMPLHAAAADLNDAMNQLANAIVRFAWEVNIPAAELAVFNLDGAATTGRNWISWGALASALSKTDPATHVLPHFELALDFRKCVDDPAFEFEYRHSRTHREFPATVDQPYLDRSIPKSPTFQLPRQDRAHPLPPLEPTRQRLADTAQLVTTLFSAILAFIPIFGKNIGLPIEISGHTVTLTLQANPSRIAVPARVVLSADGSVQRVTAHRTLQSTVLPRDKRITTPFLR